MSIIFPEILPQMYSLPLFAVGAGVDHVQENIKRDEGYHGWQWIQVTRGSGQVVCPHGTWQVQADMGFFLWPNEPHEYYRTGQEFVVDWICFHGHALNSIFPAGPIQHSGAFNLLSPNLTRRMLRSCFDSLSAGGLVQAYEASGHLYQMLLSLLSGAYEPGKEAAETGYLRLKPVLSWMEQHLEKPVNVDDIARVILVSPAHLCRLFRRHLGSSPLEYLITMRMDRARNLLLSHPELRVKEIADMVGYTDENYFARMFRARFGMSARDFRKLHGY